MTTQTIEAIQLTAPGTCVVFHDVGWEEYERFLKDFDERRLPHSYVNGELRVMSPSARHESPKKWIARLVEALTEELGMPCRSIGSLTIKLGLEVKGAEPDEGYLLANASAIRGRREYDYRTDPPPDLLIEIDITSPSLNRLPVYAALGVPEVWIYDGEHLQVGLRRDDDTYAASETSRAFPGLPMKDFAAWIEQAYVTDETDWIRSFRQWVRANVAAV
jgi:Uma2 family endonuclease